MRILFFVLVVFAAAVFGQTPVVNQSFAEATRRARNLQYESAIEKYQLTLLQAENEQSSDAFLARIHFNIGACFYQLKNPARAAEEFTEAIKLSKRDYQKAFYALGMARKDLKNWRESEIAFRAALKIKKDDGEAWFDLAMVFLEEKDFDAAEKAFGKSIEYESVASADAHNNIGVIYALKTNFSSAEIEFENALTESKGKSVEARNNLRFCQLYKRNFNQNLLAELEFSRR
ncbi:MAG: tetratricopeptide repeat protein [Pyrinomonadaceae bacterium]